MTAPDSSPVNYRVAEFAWRVKNWVRPLGLSALKLPCQLLGTGMAFPWDAIRTIDLATGWIVEDVKLGLDLALAGHAPVFCPSARVSSCFPSTFQGAETQRRRWEHGHLSVILTIAPRLLYVGLTTGNLGLLTLALDIAVPPLSLLGILVIASLGLSILAAVFGFSLAPLIVSMITATAFLAGAILSWWQYGRDLLQPAAMFSIAAYVVAKLPLYYKIIFRRTASHWIRTDRQHSESTTPRDLHRD
jgi:cellulose synthase/poly-beta-1,6-N-acetylglucosamine synthase-like glycosyltransferase